MKVINNSNKRLVFPQLSFSIGSSEIKEISENLEEILLNPNIEEVKKTKTHKIKEEKEEEKEEQFKE